MTTIFTSYEKLFATWIMHHQLNDAIEVTDRFPKCDQDHVFENYYTIPEEMLPPKEIDEDELVKLCQKRVTYFKNDQILKRAQEGKSDLIRQVQLSDDESSVPSGSSNDDTNQQVQQKEQPEPIYDFVHGLEVQAVEKNTAAEMVKYGNFWGRTHFVTTAKQTGYFLVDGWLVVSVPTEETNEEPLELNFDDTITIHHKFDIAENSVSNKVRTTVQTWFARQREKLFSALIVSFGTALLLSLSVIALHNRPMFAADLLSRIFLVASFAMQSLCLYVGFQLFRLYQLEETTSGMNDLGHWVKTVRVFAGIYPKLSSGAPIDKFFTPVEQQFLNQYHS
ncbi:MAG TPA: hypothetical protein VFU89_01075 [Rhabdochlamydiaceae bacterium]|nr:hypothetical protein [Rhabdochlamydiaceae bacterium]